jgi:hypothetical protein
MEPRESLSPSPAPLPRGPSPAAKSRWTWDFSLLAATLALLFGLGLQSLAGTIYVAWAQRAIEGWMRRGYPAYLELMNAVALPQVVALVAVMGLCVPKRLFERRRLIAVSALMAIAGLAAGALLRSAQLGLAVYLGLAALIQAAVVALALAGAPSLRFLSEGRLAKIGSGLLHMGFLLIGLVVLALRETAAMMPVFALASLLVLAGSALAFWSGALSARLGPPARGHRPEEC